MSADLQNMGSKEAGAPARRLTLLYILALSTVAILSIGAQGLIQGQLLTGQSDSRVINVAGRQRMLSQRLAKTALRLGASDDSSRGPSRAELTETLREWSRAHRALQLGDDELRLPGNPSDEVRVLYSEIEEPFQAMREAASRLTDESLAGEAARRSILAIQAHEGAFLSGMDAVVRQYVAEAERRVARLRRLEHAILLTTLLVLLAEGFFVFRPAVRRIGQTVTRLESLSRRLDQARTVAEEASDAKTRFLANVSHELRTPMTAVLGMNELARETDDPVERERCLVIVDEAGKSLLGLLNDLIDVARIDADEMRLDEAPFRVAAPVRRAVRMLGRSAEEKGVSLRVVAPDDAGRHTVLGDEGRLVQVLINLIANAIKWTDQGEIVVSCESRRVSDDAVEVSYAVQDTGVGIPAEQQSKVFEAFSQADREGANNKGGGGLGLAICQRIVDALGGGIELQSEPGEGTSVRVGLRLPSAAGRPSRDPVDAEPLDRVGPLRVLAVEDTAVNRVFLTATLERAGHRLTTAPDGETALLRYAEGDFDVVLVDLQLPGIDGGETARRLRAIDRERGGAPTPLLCLTAHASLDHATPEDPFEGLLTKPVTSAKLLAEIARITASGPTEPHVDLQPVEASASLHEELAAEFLAVAPAELAGLRAAAEERDAASVALVSHRLLGQVAYFDAPDASAAFMRLEQMARDADLEGLPGLANEAIGLVDALCARLEGQGAIV